MSPDTKRSVSVKSAARVLDLLELLAAHSEGIRVNEVGRQLGIPKSSASALLSTLEGRGYVAAGVDGYRLAPQHHDGWVGGDFARLMRTARPVMAELVLQTSESAFLGILTSEWNVEYVEKVASNSPLRYDVALGTVRAAYCTSVGHVLLAGQEDRALRAYFARGSFSKITPRTLTDPGEIEAAVMRVRSLGFAHSADSHVLGASGVAAPVRSGSGRTIAGLAVMAPSQRFKPARDAITRSVTEAASRISHCLSRASQQPQQPQQTTNDKGD